MKWAGVVVTGVLLLCVSCGGSEEPKKSPDASAEAAEGESGGSATPEAVAGGIELVGDVAVLTVPPAGEYKTLKPEAKKALKAEWKKALSADLELYDLRGKENRRIKKMLEGIVQHGDGVPPSIYKRVGRYTREVWLNRGVTDLETGARIEPGFIPGELAAAANIAITNGATMDMPKAAGSSLEANRLEELEGLLAIVRPEMFGPMRGLVDGGVGALRTRADEGAVSSTGAPSRWKHGTDVEIPGATVTIEDGALSPGLKKLWDGSSKLIKKVRNVGGLKSTAPEGPGRRVTAAKAVYAGGLDAVPVPSRGDLLWRGPVRVEDGESVYLSNLAEVYFERVGGKLIGATAPGEEGVSKDLFVRFQLAVTALSEIAGTGKDGTQSKPDGWMEDRLGEHTRIVNTLRRELAALYLLDDDALLAAGFRKDEADVAAMYRLFVALAAAGIGSAQSGDTLIAARRSILGHLLVSGQVKLVKSQEDGGAATLQVGAREAFSKALREQLAEIRRIRFSGDRAGAARFVSEGEEAIPKELDAELSRRFERAKVPSRVSFLYPLFGGEDGLNLEASGSLKEHYLYLSGLGAPRDPYAAAAGLQKR